MTVSPSPTSSITWWCSEFTSRCGPSSEDASDAVDELDAVGGVVAVLVESRVAVALVVGRRAGAACHPWRR